MDWLRRARPDADGYYATVPATAVQENEMTPVKVRGQKIILTRWQERLLAFDHACPHAAADLTRGELYRGRVHCPEHDYKFDIVTGRALYPPDEVCRLKQYPVRQVAGLVQVRLDQG